MGTVEGNNPQQVQAGTVLPRSLHGPAESVVGEEGSVGEGLVNAHAVGEDAPAGPDVQVPCFRVAHGASGHPDGLAGRLEPRGRPLLLQPIHHRRLCLQDQIPPGVVAGPPAVGDDQEDAPSLPGHTVRQEAAARHLPRLRQAQEVQQRWGHVGQFAPFAQGDTPQRRIHHGERHGAIGVAGIHGAFGVEPSFHRAVVGSDHGRHATGLRRRHFADTSIHLGHGSQDGRAVLDVPHHVHVGKVDHDQVRFRVLQRLHRCLRHLLGAHLRHLGVVLNLWGGNDEVGLSGERLLPLAVEEIPHVDGLFRFCNLDLPEAVGADNLAQGVADLPHRWKGHSHGQIPGVLDHGGEMHLDGRAREVGELLLHEGAGQFDLPLASDVVKDHIVAVADAAHRPTGAVHPHQRLQRLILLAGPIGRPYGLGHWVMLWFCHLSSYATSPPTCACG